MIPATAGFTLLTLFKPLKNEALPSEDEMIKSWIGRTTIIAWRLSDDDPRPVTVDDADPTSYSRFSDSYYAIACPNGRVTIMGEMIVDSVEEFVRYAMETWKRERENAQDDVCIPGAD